MSQVACNALETTLEADSHADTKCLGGGVLKIYDYNCPINVQGYEPSLGAKQYCTISGALAYVNPFTGLKYHLISHQAIHIPDLDHHLLCPMQCCANSVVINECPQMYCHEPTQESHAIVAMDENGASVVLPFFLRGVTSHLNVMLLTRDKFEHHGCTRIELRSRDLTWDPSTDIYEDQENAMMDFQGDIVRPRTIYRGHLMVINSVTVSTCLDADDVMSDENFGNLLQSNVNVSHIKVLNTHNLSRLYSEPSLINIQSTKGRQVNSETLENRWNIELT